MSNKSHHIAYLLLLSSLFYSAPAHTLSGTVVQDTLTYAQDMQKVKKWKATADSLMRELEYEVAVEHYKKAAQLLEKHEEWEQYVRIYSSISNGYTKNYQVKKAEEYTRKALEVGLEKLPENSTALAENYHNLGHLLSDFKKENKEALLYADKAISILMQTEDDRSRYQGLYFLNTLMARTYRQLQDNDNAYLHFHSALNYAKRYNEVTSDSPAVLFLQATANYNLGMYYHDLDPDSALYYYSKSLEFINSNSRRGKSFQGEAFTTMSIVYRKKGAYSDALTYVQKGLDIKLDLYADDSPSMAHAYLQYGRLQAALNKYDLALSYFQKALISLVEDFQDTSFYSNPPLNDIRLYRKLLDVFHSKAICLERKYDHETNDLKDLKFAFATTRRSIDLVDSARYKYYIKESGARLASFYYARFYEKTIDLAYRIYGLTREKNYLHEAYSIAEKSRAFQLQLNMEKSEIQEATKVPDQYLQQEKYLKTRIAHYERKLKRARQKNDLVAVYKDSIFEANMTHKRLVKALEQDYPEYYRSKYASKVPSPGSIQEKLPDENTLFLEYFMGDSSLYAFAIHKNSLDFYKLANLQEIKTWSQELKKKVSLPPEKNPNQAKEHYRDYTQVAYKLYKALIDQPLSRIAVPIKHLIIATDGSLSQFPFEALLATAQELPDGPFDPNYRNLPYLVRDYAISYAYSGTLFSNSMGTSYSENNGQALAFAPEYHGKTEGLAMRNSIGSLRGYELSILPGAQKEIKAISNYFGGTFLSGEEATEDNFKAEAKDYSIIHLAMHGEAEDRNSDFSRLIFNSTQESQEDDTLFTYELYNVPLTADLVVLSACETGKGTYQRGEGVTSLATGFIQAGASGVVRTLWKVYDGVSVHLMDYFYKNLSEGLSKDVALQQAKLSYLEERATNIDSHPFYWSGYTFSGDFRPLPKRSNSLLFWVVGFLLVASLVAFLYRFRQKA